MRGPTTDRPEETTPIPEYIDTVDPPSFLSPLSPSRLYVWRLRVSCNRVPPPTRDKTVHVVRGYPRSSLGSAGRFQKELPRTTRPKETVPCLNSSCSRDRKRRTNVGQKHWSKLEGREVASHLYAEDPACLVLVAVSPRIHTENIIVHYSTVHYITAAIKVAITCVHSLRSLEQIQFHQMQYNYKKKSVAITLNMPHSMDDDLTEAIRFTKSSTVGNFLRSGSLPAARHHRTHSLKVPRLQGKT